MRGPVAFTIGWGIVVSLVSLLISWLTNDSGWLRLAAWMIAALPGLCAVASVSKVFRWELSLGLVSLLVAGVIIVPNMNVLTSTIVGALCIPVLALDVSFGTRPRITRVRVSTIAVCGTAILIGILLGSLLSVGDGVSVVLVAAVVLALASVSRSTVSKFQSK